MLSIIVSSYRENLIAQLADNIETSIGDIRFEIIRINNPGIMSLSKAYNKGGKQAKFENLLFVHEDIKFISQDWGPKVLEILKIEKLGIAGLAGGVKKFKLPTGHDQGIDKYRRVFVKHTPEKVTPVSTTEALIPVKTLDGVFLAMRRERWEELKFNENLDGFHFYDLDISLRSSAIFTNYVITTIPIIHYSKGNFGDSWIEHCLKFHKLDHNYDSIETTEKESVRKFWYERLLTERISFKNRIRYLYKMGVDRQSVREALAFLWS